MRRQLSALAVIGLFLSTFLIPPLWATDIEDVGGSWILTPEADRPHMAKRLLALPVFQSLTVVACELEYNHTRVRYFLDTGAWERLEMPKKGKMKVRFEIVTKTGTTFVDQRSTRVKNDEIERRHAWMGWADGSGIDSDDFYKPVAAFPLRVESGDVLLFSVQFKKRPELLAVERTDTELRKDRISLRLGCTTCGSSDTPCPER